MNYFIGEHTYIGAENRNIDINNISDVLQVMELYLWKNDDVTANLYIGKYCSIAKQVKFLLGGYHPINCISTFPFFVDAGTHCNNVKKQDIIIGNDVYIGIGAKILAGVTIGDGAVIGAYSVVTKNVEPYTVVGGNPAKFIKKRFPDNIIEELLKIKWWDYPDNVVYSIHPLLTNTQKPIELIIQDIKNILSEYNEKKQ